MIRGILGGSFDPVHLGHVAMARHVLKRDLVQVVQVIPAHLSPHKEVAGASAEHRLAMVRLAFADLADVVIDTQELERPAPSYSVDSLEEIRRRHPGDDLVFIMGEDTVPTLPRWHELERITELTGFLVLARSTAAAASLEIPAELVGRLAVRWVSDFDMPVASTTIRAILDGGEEARAALPGLLPPAVLAYISRHQLYRTRT